jgi:CheY-like chemotaxis protein
MSGSFFAVGLFKSAKERSVTTSSAPASDLVSHGPQGEGPVPHAPLVLLVEDNEYLAATMVMMLEDLGYGVRHVRTARDALDIIDGQADGPFVDLVLSDIVMPGGMNGLDLARDLRARKPALPVILATGYAHAARDAVAEGFRLMTKPYPLDQLQAVLQETLGLPAPAPLQSDRLARSGRLPQP